MPWAPLAAFLRQLVVGKPRAGISVRRSRVRGGTSPPPDQLYESAGVARLNRPDLMFGAIFALLAVASLGIASDSRRAGAGGRTGAALTDGGSVEFEFTSGEVRGGCVGPRWVAFVLAGALLFFYEI